MFGTEQTIRSVVRELKRFSPSVHVPGPHAQALFMQALESEPKLLYYISGYRFSGTLSGGEFCVTYCNTETPPSEILTAETADEVEDLLHAAVGKIRMEQAVIVPAHLNTDRVYNDFMMMYSAFYSNLVQLECRTQSGLSERFKVVVFLFRYRIGRVKLNMMENAVRQKVAALAPVLFTADMKPETKAYIAHNFLARTVEYWKKEEPNQLERSYMQSAYGALINGRCVCQGYAEAYKRLLGSQGIFCEVICGKIRGSAEHHAWNIVSPDGRSKYHVDVTWDSGMGAAKSDEYFGLTDAQLAKDRIWTRRTDMVCTGGKNILQEAKLQIARNRAAYLAKGVDRRYLS